MKHTFHKIDKYMNLPVIITDRKMAKICHLSVYALKGVFKEDSNRKQ